ncbi:SDR family oxidoreductase [Oceanicoccus sagamiensis]|nr:SDR family oxidoreductase [Oceanicoccus sagamiensis]
MRVFFVVVLLSHFFISTMALAAEPTVFITGANRGIGLEFVNQYSQRGWTVIATARKPAEADDLNALAAERNNITVEQLDVTDHARIDALAEKYKDQPIDVLLNNAAITPKYMSAFKKVDGVDYDMAKLSYDVNALGPLKMSQAFMSNVEASEQKKIIVISSKAGSFQEGPQRAMMYSYRASKSALNMMMYTLAFETAKDDVILTLLSPGTVNTMGVLGRMMPGSIQPEESVTNMVKLIGTLKPEHNGKMLNHSDGALIAW